MRITELQKEMQEKLEEACQGFEPIWHHGLSKTCGQEVIRGEHISFRVARNFAAFDPEKIVGIFDKHFAPTNWDQIVKWENVNGVDSYCMNIDIKS